MGEKCADAYVEYRTVHRWKTQTRTLSAQSVLMLFTERLNHSTRKAHSRSTTHKNALVYICALEMSALHFWILVLYPYRNFFAATPNELRYAHTPTRTFSELPKKQ